MKKGREQGKKEQFSTSSQTRSSRCERTTAHLSGGRAVSSGVIRTNYSCSVCYHRYKRTARIASHEPSWLPRATVITSEGQKHLHVVNSSWLPVIWKIWVVCVYRHMLERDFYGQNEMKQEMLSSIIVSQTNVVFKVIFCISNYQYTKPHQNF